LPILEIRPVVVGIVDAPSDGPRQYGSQDQSDDPREKSRKPAREVLPTSAAKTVARSFRRCANVCFASKAVLARPLQERLALLGQLLEPRLLLGDP